MSKIEIVPGSISHGTLRDWDLLNAFFGALSNIQQQLLLEAPTRHASVLADAAGYIDLGEDRFERMVTNGDIDAYEILDRLSSELGEYAPPNHYFGSHVGDHSDFGWWPCEDTDCEDEQGYDDLAEDFLRTKEYGL